MSTETESHSPQSAAPKSSSQEPQQSPLLHKEKAARELLGGISHSLLFKLIQTGQLPVVRLCGRNLYADDDIRALIAKRRTTINGEVGQ